MSGRGRGVAAIYCLVAILLCDQASATDQSSHLTLSSTEPSKFEISQVVQPGILDGKCVSPRPAGKQTPTRYSERESGHWFAQTVDIDCIEKYYPKRELDRYEAAGDFVASYVSDLTDPDFLKSPCKSTVEQKMDSFLAMNPEERLKLPRLIFVYDLYFTAGRIKQICGENALPYLRKAAVNPGYMSEYYKASIANPIPADR